MRREVLTADRHSYRIIYSGDLEATGDGCIFLILLVGAGRFELPTPCAQGRCATRLRYAPTFEASLILNHVPWGGNIHQNRRSTAIVSSRPRSPRSRTTIVPARLNTRSTPAKLFGTFTRNAV